MPSDSVVVDASFVVRLLVPYPETERAGSLVETWRAEKRVLEAPQLMYLEVVSALRRQVFARTLRLERALAAIKVLYSLGVEVRPTDIGLCEAALSWADKLGQAKAYDSFYLALAEQLNAELWTADDRLAQRARQVGADWVRSLL